MSAEVRGVEKYPVVTFWGEEDSAGQYTSTLPHGPVHKDESRPVVDPYRPGGHAPEHAAVIIAVESPNRPVGDAVFTPPMQYEPSGHMVSEYRRVTATLKGVE